MGNGHLVSISAEVENDPEGWEIVSGFDQPPEELEEQRQRLEAQTEAILQYVITVRYVLGTSGHIHTVYGSLGGIDVLTGTAEEREQARKDIFDDMTNDISELTGELKPILTASELKKFRREAKEVCEAAADGDRPARWRA